VRRVWCGALAGARSCVCVRSRELLVLRVFRAAGRRVRGGQGPVVGPTRCIRAARRATPSPVTPSSRFSEATKRRSCTTGMYACSRRSTRSSRRSPRVAITAILVVRADQLVDAFAIELDDEPGLIPEPSRTPKRGPRPSTSIEARSRASGSRDDRSRTVSMNTPRNPAPARSGSRRRGPRWKGRGSRQRCARARLRGVGATFSLPRRRWRRGGARGRGGSRPLRRPRAGWPLAGGCRRPR